VTTKTDDEEIVIVAAQVAEYISAHPDAADSAIGITKWWFKRQQLERAVEQVERALEYLVAEGVLVRKKIAGTTIYVKNR